MKSPRLEPPCSSFQPTWFCNSTVQWYFVLLLPLLQLKHNSGTTVHISSSLPEKLWHCLLIAEMLVETQGTKLLMVSTPNSTILCWHLGSEEHSMFWGRKMSFFLIWLASVPGYLEVSYSSPFCSKHPCALSMWMNNSHVTHVTHMCNNFLHNTWTVITLCVCVLS